jgi:folate-binding protein YgfZ
VERFSESESPRRLEESELERERIGALRPRIDREIVRDVSNPRALGLREAIAENKGCYPGQEVIEKIISLGSPPKRLALLSGTEPAPAVGAVLKDEKGSDSGTVTSVEREEGEGFRALALLRKNAAIEGNRLKAVGPGDSSAEVEASVERVSDYE